MELLLALLPGVLIMVLMLVYAFRRYDSMQPRVMLTALPQDVENGLTDETPEARGYWKQFAEFASDFERAGHPFQYRQLIDLMACGPWPLTVAAARALNDSRHFGRYASDLELRNELGEVVAHNFRRLHTRADLQTFSSMLERLVALGGHNEEAIGVWLDSALTEDLTGECPRRQLLAVHALAGCGTPAMVEQARAASQGTPMLQHEFDLVQNGSEATYALPPATGDALPPYADVAPDGVEYSFAKPVDPAPDSQP